MKKPVKVVCALVALGAVSLASSAFAATGECTLQGMYQSSLIFNWNNTGIWKDGYVPQSGDDVSFPTKPGRTLTVRLQSGLELGTVTGTAGFYLKNPDTNTGSFSVSDASEFLGSWYLRNHNVLTLTGTAALNQLVSNGGPQLKTTSESASLAQLYGAGALYKNDTGKLSVGSSSGATSVIVNGGEVEFAAAKTDLAGLDEVLAKAEIHYDATVRESLAFDGGNRVIGWLDQAGAAQNAAVATVASGSAKDSKYPGAAYVEDYQNGLPVLDFGPYCDASGADPVAANSTAMTFARNVFAKAYFIVIADREREPAKFQDLICDYEDVRWTRTATGGFFGAETEPGTDVGEVYVNGNRVLPQHEVRGTDLKVVSYRSQLGRIGTYCPIDALAFASRRYSGGIRVGEVIRFNETLTDAEMELVTRYLMKKWIPQNGGSVRQADSVVLSGGATSAVGVTGEGTFAAKRLFVSGDTLVKKGMGTLAVDAVATKDGASLTVDVQGGAVLFGKAAETTAQIAADPLYHFDASALTEADGTALSRWEDVRGGDRPAMVASTKTFAKGDCALPTVVENVQNGLRAVDFGSRVCVNDAAPADIANSAGSKLDSDPSRAMVREGFYVAKKKTGYNTFPLGSTFDLSFHPGDWGILLNQTYGGEGLQGGFWTVDGNPVDPCVKNTADNAFHLVHFVSSSLVRFNTFAWDRSDGSNFGGVQMGEAILYDRELTTAERIATETRLLEKWFAKAHPQASPATVNLAYGASTDNAVVGGDGTVSVGTLAASGAVEKVGDGAMTVGTLAGATALAVSGGSLTVADPLEGVLSKAALHLDASDDDSITETTDETHGTYVSEWRDVRANGLKAVPYTDCTGRPKLAANDCNSLNTVNFGSRTDWGSRNAANATGAGMELSRAFNVKEAFIVFRQYLAGWGYCFILTATDAYNFHRADDGRMWIPDYTPNFKDEPYRLDLDIKDNTYKLTDANYHFIQFHAKAGGSGRCNTICHERDQRLGGMRYGEIVLFETELTEAERDLVSKHLLKKWRDLDLDVPTPSNASFDSLSAAKGTSLSLGYESVDVSALAGSGTIDGNVTLAENGTVTAQFAADGTLTPLTVTGAFTLPTAGKVVVDCPVRKVPAGEYPLIVSDDIEAGPLPEWTVEAPETMRNTFSVRRVAGRLVLTVGTYGMTVILK